jgi:hypothetical protein
MACSRSVGLKFITSVAAVARRRRETRCAGQGKSERGQVGWATLDGHTQGLGAERGHLAFSCTSHVKYIQQETTSGISHFDRSRKSISSTGDRAVSEVKGKEHMPVACWYQGGTMHAPRASISNVRQKGRRVTWKRNIFGQLR